MAGPVSSRTSGWKLHDFIFVLFFGVLIVLLVVGAVKTVAPNSGLSVALHGAGQATSHFLQLIAAFFTMVASWFALL